MQEKLENQISPFPKVKITKVKDLTSYEKNIALFAPTKNKDLETRCAVVVRKMLPDLGCTLCCCYC